MRSDDSKKVLTNFITSGDEDPEQKTVLNHKEQYRFGHAYEVTGSIPEFECDFMVDMAMKSDKRMMSFKARRSDDIVNIARGLEESDMKAAGVQAIEELSRYKHGRKGNPNPD